MARLSSHFFGVLFIVLSALSLHAQQPKGAIEGTILDRDTKQPIYKAKVTVLKIKRTATSDSLGRFRIDGLESGTYSIGVMALEYRNIVKTDIRVGPAQSAKITLELQQWETKSSDVVISANKDKFFENREDTRVSSNMLSQEEVRRAPGAVEDVSRMVQGLPGVVTASDARNDIIARGGSPSENFIMIDGIEVPNINHYATQGASGGPIGMINVDFLQDVNFSAGGFGVKYGDRLSSIMDITYREGDKHGIHGKVDIGLGGGGIILEGPLQTDKSSFLISARRSYLDLIIGGTGLTAVPNYWNFNTKATYILSQSHKLTFIGLGGIDAITFDDFGAEDSPFLSKRTYTGWQGLAGVSDNWLVSPNCFIRSSISANAYNVDFQRDTVGRNQNYNRALEREFLFRSDISYRFSSSDLLELGLTAKSIQAQNELYDEPATDGAGVQRPGILLDMTTNATKAGVFGQFTHSFLGVLDVTAGVRLDYFSYLNSPVAFSPRISASYQATENIRLNVSGGLYAQAPPLFWLIGDARNKDLEFMKTTQLIAGIEYLPVEDIKITLEVFSKEYKDYPTSVLNPQYSYSNAGTDYNLINEYLLPASTGYARGVEVFFHKKLTDRLYSMINYGYSQIRFTALDGVERPSSFDFQHIFTLIGGYKLMDNLDFSMKFRYGGGRPITPFNTQVSEQARTGVFDFTRFNSERLDDYYRLDLRIDYRISIGEGINMLVFFDAQNATNRANIENPVWNEKTNKADRILQWQFLPVGGVKVEF